MIFFQTFPLYAYSISHELLIKNRGFINFLLIVPLYTRKRVQLELFSYCIGKIEDFDYTIKKNKDIINRP